MSVLEIKKELDTNEVSKNLSSYRFEETITQDQLFELLEYLQPSDYKMLSFSNAISHVDGVLPFETFQILTDGTTLTHERVLAYCKVDEQTIQYVIDNMNNLDIDSDFILTHCELTTEQIIHVLTTHGISDGTVLGTVIGGKRDVELAKHIIRIWSEIKFSVYDRSSELNSYRYHLFIAFSSVIMNEDDQMELFSMIRPYMSANKLRDYEPCSLGWRRVLNWAARDGHLYSWNEFIARHILANKEEIEEAKSDLVWLAETILEEEEGYIV